jgi:hypothetical protein
MLRAPGPIVDLLTRIVHRDRAKRVASYADLSLEISACSDAMKT